MFWIIAALTGVLTLAYLMRPVFRRDVQAVDAPDLEVYRSQLAEVDRDLERGVIASGEAAALRTEVSRRLLAAADAVGADGARDAGEWATLSGGAIVLFAGLFAIVMYLVIGAPGVPDQPRALRIAEAELRRASLPAQSELERTARAPVANVPDDVRPLLDQLETALADRPNDVDGRRILAQTLARTGQFSKAARVQTELLTLVGEAATGEDHLAQAEYMIFASQGLISAEADAALRSALSLGVAAPRARYFAGLAAWQIGRPDQAYDLWARLLDESAPTAPWVAPIEARMPALAAAAGQPVPEFAPRPDAAEIRAMVEGLAARLEEDGGTPEEWGRLIRSWTVLGDTEAASAALAAAEAAYYGDASALALIADFARAAGLTP
ncbi:MAG: c-type cytochrome biogenesis protein CcmI [Pseudomonadota bacterium]